MPDFNVGGGAEQAGQDPNQGAAGNNTGNSGQGANQSESGADNTGQTVLPEDFWDQGNAAEEEVDDSKEFTTNLANQLTSMSFGGDLVTPDMHEALQNGDYTALNKQLQTQMQTAVRQSLTMAISVMNRMQGVIMKDVQSQINGTLSSRDQKDYIAETFPSARDPRMRPQVESVFNQAMKIAKGNRQAATAMTHAMLQTAAQAFGRDTGVNLDASSQEQGGELVNIANLLSAK